MRPYQMHEDELCAMYATDAEHGLTSTQVKEQHKRFGINILPEKGPESWVHIFLRQFQNPLIYILLAAATLIFFVGPDKTDAFIITGILLFNALIGTIQEGRTSRILASLKTFLVSDCVVIRDGVSLIVNAEDLVPGDIVLLQEGQRVPADMRIINANVLRVDEAVLTGESFDVSKDLSLIHI